MTAHQRLDPPLVESIRKALTGNAIPGETQGLTREGERAAAEFLAELAATRGAGASASSSTTCLSLSIPSPMQSRPAS
jgi:glutamate dehydrogenase